MDVSRSILAGIQSEAARSLISIVLSISLYSIYSIVDYSSKNIPSKSLLPSYDFIVIGGGSAGTFLSRYQ